MENAEIRRWKSWLVPMVLVCGAVVGVAGVFLSADLDSDKSNQNPPNMGFCTACFERDIAGALGLHRAAIGQVLRPEIGGVLIGAFLAAWAGREVRRRSAPSPLISFTLGVFTMVGALVFLGCPLRMTFRLAGGDGNALVGLGGFVAGIFGGTLFLKKGYSLGRAHSGGQLPVFLVPLLAAGMVAMVFIGPSFLLRSTKGPGAMAAAPLLSLGAGLLIGVLAQRSRLCFAGGFRDMILLRNPHLLIGFLAVLITALGGNLILGTFHPGFYKQPIAHDLVLWNFMGMALVGLASVLLGGCPFRQLVLAAQGDGSAAMAVIGMIVGAAFCHNMMLAASPAGVPVNGQIAVGAGLVFAVVIGRTQRES